METEDEDVFLRLPGDVSGCERQLLASRPRGQSRPQQAAVETRGVICERENGSFSSLDKDRH